MKTVRAIRYVTPLREGGSVPAVIEADDDGTYVLKFRGAAQGPRALVAEIVCGELARALGLPMPQAVLIELDPVLGRSEPDGEIRDLIKASGGLNYGMDFLQGALGWEPSLLRPDPRLAARIVWFDAFVSNIDRTARNPNLLVWHRALQLIDHGAALYFHHDWATQASRSQRPFAAIREHVLLPFASDLLQADAALAPLADEKLLRSVLAQVPDEWLSEEPAERMRDGYVQHLLERARSPRAFATEAERVRVL
jgi:hypothetical protein